MPNNNSGIIPETEAAESDIYDINKVSNPLNNITISEIILPKDKTNYFIIIPDIMVPGGRRDIIGWDDKNNGMIYFADDLINGQNNSSTATNWFMKTEEILNKINYR